MKSVDNCGGNPRSGLWSSLADWRRDAELPQPVLMVWRTELQMDRTVAGLLGTEAEEMRDPMYKRVAKRYYQ